MSIERIEELAGTVAPAGGTVLARPGPDGGRPEPPLLTAKLTATPRSGAVLLPRPRLFDLLDRGTAGPLTLVSASAGWGKTVLLSSWCRARNASDGRAGNGSGPGPVAWLSLEPGDGGARLWSYLYAALRPAVDGPEPDARAEPDPGYGLESFADQLARRPRPATLILDDLHQVDDPEVSSGLEFLLRHTAGRLRLVIGCRADPGLALHRWRLSGELTEIRAADLAFRPDEVADLFSAYGEPLPPEQTHGLVSRTEGWPAGLRFAALALPGHPDPARFVDEFTGEHPDVADYLTEELLTGLSGDAREALCRASLVAGFSAELLGALTGRTDGARILSEVGRLGGFVIPLGGRPAGYRCHPMLGDLLRADLARRPLEQVAELHRRAASWFTANGLPAEALRHALAAADRAYATDVLRRHWPDLVPYGQRGPARPAPPAPAPEVVRADPELGLAYAADRLDGGEPVAAAGYLGLADEHSHPLDTAARQRVRRIGAALRLAVAHLEGDEAAVRATAGELLHPDAPGTNLDTNPGPIADGAADADDSGLRAGAVARIVPATMRFGTGEVAAAEPQLADGLAAAVRAGLPRTGRLCLGRLALARAIRGELTAADEAARSVLGTAPLGGLVRPADGVHAHLAQALVALYRDRQDDAESHLALAVRAAGHVDEPLVHGVLGVIEAQLLRDRGDLTGAHQALAARRRRLGDRAEAQPLAHWLLAAEAEVWMAHGDVELAREMLTSALDREVVPAEPVAIALARAHLRARDPQAAVRALPDWDGPAGGKPPPSPPLPPPPSPPPLPLPLPLRLAAGILDASASRLAGDHRRAARILERVLRLAEPEGFRQVFTRADPPVRDLLAAHLDSGTAFWPMVDDLLGAADGAGGGPTTPAGAPPSEPLTEREMTVLRYLQSILSNVEIAAELSLSVNTVKTHVRNIYRKLDATRRRDAVRRARELHLL
ncbi:LuxR C-terminal-related transcriptional regulator [Plantactinospora sp. WMMB334]|uniref:LuxR C-terminal-related transcriptional regulator n=1 Tax=Plantactinospora sp. WMMB334 TaxID=3404119 RepID=UPI003B963B71